MLNALQTKFSVPEYLMRVMRDYLKDRILIYDTEQGQRRKTLSGGASQGSILGPDLWNVLYDGLFEIEMPTDTEIVGYADDVGLLIEARTSDKAQWKMNQAMRRIKMWMAEHHLELAEHKTQILMLTRKHIPTIIPFRVGDSDIETVNCAKYLGVTLDTKLNFWTHIQKAADKAAQTMTALSRLMANTNGPKSSKRRLLMSVTLSILLYGAEIWAGALNKDMYRKRMAAIQRRGALRISCAYRTVSEAAVLVIANTPPIDLLALERQEIWHAQAEQGRDEAKKAARYNLRRKWQERWDQTTSGKWTAKRIPRLNEWIDRTHG